MEMPGLLISIAELCLLASVLYYQRKHSVYLERRIAEQGKLLQETNSLVLNLVTAMQGQGSVVDAAVKYAREFDPAKLEAWLRREIELEYEEKLRAKESAAPPSQNMSSMSDEVLLDYVANRTLLRISPLLKWGVLHVFSMPLAEREKALAELEPSLAQTISAGFEKAKHRILADLDR
jgi:uncharacterized coiled-coil protein SlyX